MKLDPTDLRYILPDEFKVLQAVEQGSKNHEIVPLQLIAQLSRITGGNVNKCLSSLAKRGLVGRAQGAKYDGYRLTYGGLDFLALKSFSKRNTITSVGQRVGVGKEGDINIVKGKGRNAWVEGEEENVGEGGVDEVEERRVLKIHRLGRISFRQIKNKRDYLSKNTTPGSGGWMYMSRLAAKKEWEFMKILWEYGFPVPEPLDQARHCIVMSMIDGFPLRQIGELPSHTSPQLLQAKLFQLIVRLARVGLIHGDFNEFNVMIREETFEPVVIDFPQMVSVGHGNAEYFFNRDVECIRRFFRRRFRIETDDYPTFTSTLSDLSDELSGKADPESGLEGDLDDVNEGVGWSEEKRDKAGRARRGEVRLDEVVEASGFGKEMWRDLEQYMSQVADQPGENDVSSEGESDSEEEEDDVAEGSGLRKLRLDDDAPELHDNGSDGSDSGSEDESESDSGSDASSLAAPSTLAPRNTNSKSKVHNLVADELAKQKNKTEKQHHTRKGMRDVGKLKGSKWKSSKAIMVQKGGDKSGWS